MTELAEQYRALRGRLSELVGEVGDEGAATPVELCPGWSVHDVLAHLVGVCADVLAGRVEGVATDPWTAAQVDARRGATVADLLAEWEETAPQVEAMVPHFPGLVGRQFLLDATSHEHDIRAALGRPGARDTENVENAADFMVTVLLDPAVSAAGLAPVEVEAGSQRWVVGGEDVASAEEEVTNRLYGLSQRGEVEVEPDGSLLTDAFEAVRALTGRRSTAQIAGMKWVEVDPAPYTEVFVNGPFRPARTDVSE